jgi:phosphoglycolate phosphatase
MLRALRERGIRVAVVSNKFDAATKALCAEYFGDLVEVAIGERAGVRKKPAPDTVLEALRELGATTEGAVYVGDSDVDIRTAENCSMDCLSVTWGLRDEEFLLANGATTLVRTPSDLLPVIIA